MKSRFLENNHIDKKNKSLYLIELCDVELDEDGNFDDITYMIIGYCETQDEAKKYCDKLNKDIDNKRYFKVKNDNIRYPFYTYTEIYKLK